MRSRGFLFGLGGGIVGTVLVLVVLFALGLADISTTPEEIPATPTPTHYTPAPPPQGLTPEQIYDRAAPGVVMIISSFSASSFGYPFGGGERQGLGSGFVVDQDGYIVTNAHVVEEDGTRAKRIDVVFKGADSETTRVEAELVGVDLRFDVALVKVDPRKVSLTALLLGDSDTVRVGEPVVAIGNPLGYNFSLSAGVVSAIDRPLQSPAGPDVVIPNGIQTDAAINQGNSGGPLLNARGEVIGINEQIASPSGAGSVGLGFAVPVNLAVRSFQQLKESGKVTYAWLGVQGQTITPDIARTFDLPVDRGVLIAAAISGGPAAKAGLRGGSRQEVVQDQQYVLGGDIITTIDGTKILNMEDLIAEIDKHKPGERITIKYLRHDERQQVTVTLEERPSTM